MSHSLPLFFLPIDPRREEETETLLAEAYSHRKQSGLLISVSRNWWHLAELEEVSKRIGSSSLDFLWCDAQEVVLKTTQIADAIAALVLVLSEASCGSESLGTTWMMKSYRISTSQSFDTVNFSCKDRQLLMRAYAKAEVRLDVDDESHGADGEIVSYFSFLKSLFSCLSECLLNGKHLLFYQTFP